MEVLEAILAQESQGLRLTFPIMCMMFDWAYDRPPSAAFGLIVTATWHMEHWRLMIDLWQAMHWNALEKRLWIIWGTWESNPGPNACKTRFQPSEPWCTFVNVITDKNNIRKVIIMLGIQKRAPHIWIHQSRPSTHHLLHLSWNKKRANSGGFKPPQTGNIKIAIRHTINIKRERWCQWFRLVLTTLSP